jgi:hypothetical protein
MAVFPQHTGEVGVKHLVQIESHCHFRPPPARCRYAR